VAILLGAGNLTSQLIGQLGFKCDDSVMPNVPPARNRAGCEVASVADDKTDRADFRVELRERIYRMISLTKEHPFTEREATLDGS
jgi:hypothetical protein